MIFLVSRLKLLILNDVWAHKAKPHKMDHTLRQLQGTFWVKHRTHRCGSTMTNIHSIDKTWPSQNMTYSNLKAMAFDFIQGGTPCEELARLSRCPKRSSVIFLVSRLKLLILNDIWAHKAKPHKMDHTLRQLQGTFWVKYRTHRCGSTMTNIHSIDKTWPSQNLTYLQ